MINSHVTELQIKALFQEEGEVVDDKKVGESCLIHTDARGRPTALKVVIEVPPDFTMQAGQWLYFKVPEISKIQFHAFSLASGSHDDHLELQIGIIGEAHNWVENDGMRGFTNKIPPPKWELKNQKTFTYQLSRLLYDRISELAALDNPDEQHDQVKPIACHVRGPYGSCFSDCFDPHYRGAVVVGAGTGLTAAVSVIREIMFKKSRGDRMPQYLWFVWSCKRVDDLLWCWETLHHLLVEGVEKKVLKPGKKWGKNSTMLHWLNMTFYVTNADEKVLAEFITKGNNQNMDTGKQAVAGLSGGVKHTTMLDVLGDADDDEDEEALLNSPEEKDEPAGAAPKESLLLTDVVWDWMSHENRLLKGSMDDSEIHIEKLLAWARLYIDRKDGRQKKMAVSFCGPNNLGHVIGKAALKVGAGLEFTSDSQG